MIREVIIKPNANSSAKIKQRLKEHGNCWKVLNDGFFENEPALLCQSLVKPEYLRWFFKNEVTILEGLI